MLHIHRPTDADLLAAARHALQERITPHTGRGDSLLPVPVSPGSAPLFPRSFGPDAFGPAPAGFQRPAFGTPAYALACRAAWISSEEERADRASFEARRQRALRSCHQPSLYQRRRFAPPRDSGAYVPQMAARLDDDRNLTDGARRCARKIAELAYRRNRDGRCLNITVTYLMKALGKGRRSVQRYLRQLEREGYIGVNVVCGKRSRMCAGLVVHLLGPLFPRHHRDGWPERRGNPDAPKESQIKIPLDRKGQTPRVMSCEFWALRCMDGVFRSLRRHLPPLAPFPAPSGASS